MAASGYSPISLYYSTTASATPTNTNLVNGELALNITDGKLFYKDNAGTVQTLATKAATSGSFSTTTISTSETLSYGTANGVAYLNGSKVVTTGTALTFDGTNLGVGVSAANYANYKNLAIAGTTGANIDLISGSTIVGNIYNTSTDVVIQNSTSGPMRFSINGSEQMRLTSTGLGIGTSNPVTKLDIVGGGATGQLSLSTNSTNATTKEGKLVVPHYTNAEESFLVLYPYSTSTVNEIYYGGGSSSQNTATGHYWMTAANNTTVSGTVRMTLDSSGNLGLGVTPSAWSGQKALEFSYGALSAGTNLGTLLASNAYYNGTNWIYRITTASSYYLQDSAGHKWFYAPSGTAGNAITFTQAMTLDASGNLGVGTTSPASRVDVSSTSTGVVKFTAGKSGWLYADSAGIALSDTSDFTKNGLYINNTSNYVAVYTGSTGAERARIDSSGNLGVGRTNPGVRLSVAGNSDSWQLALSTNSGSTGAVIGSPAADVLAFGSWAGTERARINSDGYFKASNAGTYLNSAGTYHELRSNASASPTVIIANTNASFGDYATQVDITRNSTNNSFYAIAYYNRGAGAFRLLVADSGNVTNTNGSYGTISDAKMKTDIVDSGSQWADIKAIRFRKFKMKDDPEQVVQLGVVAQELEQTSPGLVEEHTDRDKEGNDLGTTTKSVKTSVLLMKAAVALQEAMTRIEQLEARVAQLESN